jgi:DNA-binding NarL/FixJ family response regulator
MSDSSASTDAAGVLICDDSDALRFLLTVMIAREADLRLAGEARNGREAIDEATRLQPDVILLDLSMPVMTGLAALPAVRAAAPNAHIIAFTGLAGSVAKDAVLAAGADQFLEKSVHPESIVACIRQGAGVGERASTRPSKTRRSRLLGGVLSVVASRK